MQRMHIGFIMGTYGGLYFNVVYLLMQMKTRKSSEILMYLSIIFKYVLRDEVVRMYNCTFMYMHCTKFLQEKCRDR